MFQELTLRDLPPFVYHFNLGCMFEDPSAPDFCQNTDGNSYFHLTDKESRTHKVKQIHQDFIAII